MRGVARGLSHLRQDEPKHSLHTSLFMRPFSIYTFCIPLFILLFGLCVKGYGYDTSLMQLALAEPQDLQLRDKQTPQQISESEAKSNTKVGSKFSIKSDVFMNEGHSEMELETGKANLNELDATMTRYGAGVELNYSIKPDTRVELEFFASNALEINSQRRGGKTKAYNNLLRQEEHAYNYGNKMMYSAWVSSIGAAMTILKIHKISLLFKQTQLSNSDALIAMSMTPDSVTMPNNPLTPTGGSTQKLPFNGNLNTLTTQFFLTYSYMF